MCAPDKHADGYAHSHIDPDTHAFGNTDTDADANTAAHEYADANRDIDAHYAGANRDNNANVGGSAYLPAADIAAMTSGSEQPFLNGIVRRRRMSAQETPVPCARL